MNDWSTTALLVIAACTTVMALIQVGALIYGLLLVRRVNRLVDRVEREIDPVMAKVHEISAEATRATRLAAAQVERADQLTSRLAQRAEETLDVAQQLLLRPARQILAIVEGLRAAFTRRNEPPPADAAAAPRSSDGGDDALFVG